MGNLTGRSASTDGISLEEIEKHNTKDDAWMVLFGEVLDVTKFLPIHPGGEDAIDMYLGRDATEAWVEIHTPETLERNLHHITKVGKLQAVPFCAFLSRTCFDARTAAAAPTQQEEEDDRGLQFTPQFEEELQATNGVFTLESLQRWNGVQLPMLISICGVVVDVSPSENFIPTFGYGKLWAGKDCTWAMATVSLKAEDANRFDWKVQELEDMHFKSLVGWYGHFTNKYRQVGILEELKDWDFAAVKAEAKAEPPKFSMLHHFLE
ncbi:CYB2 [Symbiodinium sp. CCMP2456]|nr:CYB2 [Symbiodinium sp. CCMP2456]